MITFSRDHTRILKGIALLLMIVHHTSTPSLWADEGSDVFATFQYLQQSAKICVYIFAFLVGYGFYCSKNKTIQYSFKRCCSLLVPFWTMLFCIFLPLSIISGSFAVHSGGNLWGGVKLILLNMFGVDETLNWYSWFVCFYILAIYSLPLLNRLFTHHEKYGWIICIGFYYICECLLHLIPNWKSNWISLNLFTYTAQMPCVILGYMCAYWNYKGLLPRLFEGKSRLPLAMVSIFAVLVLSALKIPTLGFCFQAFYTPILIFAVVGIINVMPFNSLSKFLHNIGSQSLYMWFFHAVFFTESVNTYTKRLVLEPIHNFFYTLFMTFILTYIGAWIIKKMVSPIMQRIK